MRVLITGIASPVARRVAGHAVAAGHEVIGIDRRLWEGCPGEVTMYAVDLRKRAAEEVFRKHRPEAVIHMATVTHLKASTEERYRINLGGTRAVFDHARAYGVGQVVFVGRHTYYGAGADHALYHREDDPPMAVSTFPELADLVAADLYATTALWRHPELKTAVLRMVYVLGPSGTGTLASFLRGPKVPAILGFDPLFHFMHEDDTARAVVEALGARLHGVFNVAGPPPLPLSVIVRESGRKLVPLPEFVFHVMRGRLGFPQLPPGAMTHVKYPVVVDGDAFRQATGWRHRIEDDACLREFRRTFPVRLG
ncbi:MAG: NAD-dependent epimerase/dehydratase family protein [Myxococcales bacterium]|nr:NAD-dependent epimerase/dehydratase family protein [Myxococcales bacterium]